MSIVFAAAGQAVILWLMIFAVTRILEWAQDYFDSDSVGIASWLTFTLIAVGIALYLSALNWYWVGGFQGIFPQSGPVQVEKAER
jgi:hypothetical protein